MKTIRYVLTLFFFAFTTITFTQNISIEPASHIGGNVACVATHGDYAVAVQAGYLAILDLNETNYGQKAYLDLPGMPTDIQIKDDFAYLSSDGLTVVDLSDPMNPTVHSRLELDADGDSQIYLSGNMAYMTSGTTGLYIIDITSPDSPTLLGNFSNGNNLADVMTSGNIAYVLDINWVRMLSIDVSNPFNPVQVGFANLNGARSIALTENHALVTVDSWPNIG